MTHHLLAARRGWFLSLLSAVALAAALATVSVGPDHDASATEPGHTHDQTAGHLTSAHAVSTSTPAARTAAQAAFHDQMRKLWEDHVTWTRLAIVTFADGSGGFDATAARLLANQVDIGDAIKPFYGNAAGDQLTSPAERPHRHRRRPAAGSQEPATPRRSSKRASSGTTTPTRSPTSSPPRTRSTGPRT